MIRSPRTLSTFFRNFALLVHEGRQRGLDYSSPRKHERTEQRAALRGGDNPRPRWRTSALITIWATLKLPQCSRLMEPQESIDGLRWAIGRTGAMAVIWVQLAKTAGRAVGEPSLMCT